MAYSTCEDDIKRILTELPSENHCIDYKIEPYRPETFPEFIRDVIAFLNCAESYNEDRYIIIGVGESQNSRIKIGIDVSVSPMPDDNEFQNLIDMIRPRPAVSTGTFSFENKVYGYIHILRSNVDTTYEASRTYPSKKQKIDDDFFLPANAVHEGQAYIRLSTKKVVMNQHDRRRIESQVRKEFSYDIPSFSPTSTAVKKSSLSIDLVAALIGQWSTDSSGDKKIIEELSCVKYDEWECEFQTRVAAGDERIVFSQGVWTYQGHIEVALQNAKAYFDSHLLSFYSLFKTVILTYDSKFDLPSDQRFIRSSSLPKGEYSNGLRESIIKSFVNIAVREKEFISCTKYLISNKTHNIISEVLKEGNWKVFATLDWMFVDIAQANPNAFCSTLQEVLKHPNNEIEKLLFEQEEGIVAVGYYQGLVTALQTLTWVERYFATASNLLFSLTKLKKEIADSFILVFLPWYPQTEASTETRTGAIKHLVQEYGDECWDVVFKLMPNQTHSGTEIHPPKYIEGCFEKVVVLTGEYWTVSAYYLDLLISIARINHKRIPQIIELLDDVTPPMFKKIIDLIIEVSVILDDDNDRYIIWDKILSFSERHRAYASSEWALPEDALLQIDGVAILLSPKSEDIVDSRLFKSDQYDLIYSEEDFHRSESDLLALQTASIKRIYFERQLSGVLSFASKVGSPKTIGAVLSGLELNSDEEDMVFSQLQCSEENQVELAKGYCYSKYRVAKKAWLTAIDLSSMPPKKRILILSSITICKDVLDEIRSLPKEEKQEYWTLAPNWLEDDAKVAETIEGLIIAHRLEYALRVLTHMITENKLDSRDLAYRVLEANLDIGESRSQMWDYYIKQVFTWLQKDIDKNDLKVLVNFEWCYYRVLSNTGSAKALEYILSSSPVDFITVLGMVYRSENEIETTDLNYKISSDTSAEIALSSDQRKKIAEHGWQILFNWKWMPGIQLDGTFDKEAMITWIDSVKGLSRDKGLYNVALQTIGHVLYYAPSSDDGLFIPQIVATTLEAEENEHMRIGYSTEAYNARGVYNYDPSGKQEDEIAKLWNERAVSAESYGYIRFGKTLRDIAQGFLDQKKHY